MKGCRLKSENLFKLFLFPIFLPLSLLYGLAAFINKKFSSINQVSLGIPVVSVGNFTVGGTGKTPVVFEILNILKDMDKKPIVVSKSYKASLKHPAEVNIDSKISECGDEACLIKKKFPDVRVFSGPHKTKTALFAAAKTVDRMKAVFVIDDGAQHQGLFKDFKIHVWDMSLSKLDFLPLPFGRAREFWFLGEKSDLILLNRSKSIEEKVSKKVPKFLRMKYEVQSILNYNTGKPLTEDFILISGIGNFDQLVQSVKSFFKRKKELNFKSIKGRDHDHFDWFVPEENLNYVCTEKDVSKLLSKVSKERLFVVNSSFSQNFKKGLAMALEKFFKGGEGDC